MVATCVDEMERGELILGGPEHIVMSMWPWCPFTRVLLVRCCVAHPPTAAQVEEFTNDPTLNKLIMEKWNMFGQRIHITQVVVPYILRLILTSIYLYYAAFVTRLEEDIFNEKGIIAWIESGSTGWADFKWSFDDNLLFERWFHNTLQFLCFFFVAIPTFFNGWHQRRLKDEDMDPNEDGELTTYEIIIFLYKNLLFFLSWGVSFTLTGAIVSSIMGNRLSEMELLSVSCILHAAILFMHLITFKSIGVLVIIVFKMFIGDIFKFIVVYFTLVLAFSLAFFALVQMSEDSSAMMGIDLEWKGAIVQFVLISLGNRPTTVNFWPLIKETANPSLVLAVYLVYLVIANLLMLNLLIAMMNKTFVADMQDRHKTFIFPFAHTILRYERKLSPADRARFRSGKSGAVSEGEVTMELISKTPYYHVQIDDQSLSPDEWDTDLQQQEEHSIVLDSLAKGSLQTSLEDMKRTISDLKARVVTSEWGIKHNVGETIREYEEVKQKRVSSILIDSIKGDKAKAKAKASLEVLPPRVEGSRSNASAGAGPAHKAMEVLEEPGEFKFPSFWGNRDFGEGVAVPAPALRKTQSDTPINSLLSPTDKGVRKAKSQLVGGTMHADDSATLPHAPTTAPPRLGGLLPGRALVTPSEALEAHAIAGKAEIESDLKLPGAVYSPSDDEDGPPPPPPPPPPPSEQHEQQHGQQHGKQHEQQQQLLVVEEDEEEENPWERPAASMLGKGVHGGDGEMLLRVLSGRELNGGSLRGKTRNYVPPTLPDGRARASSRSKEPRRQRTGDAEVGSQDVVQSTISNSPVSNTSDAPHGPDAPQNRRAAAADADGGQDYSNFVIPLSGNGGF